MFSSVIWFQFSVVVGQHEGKSNTKTTFLIEYLRNYSIFLIIHKSSTGIQPIWITSWQEDRLHKSV